MGYYTKTGLYLETLEFGHVFFCDIIDVRPHGFWVLTKDEIESCLEEIGRHPSNVIIYKFKVGGNRI